MCLFHFYSLFLFMTVLFVCLDCFNLDVNHTIIYEDPSKGGGSRSSYFGFSLFLYSGTGGTTSWIQIGAPRGNDPKQYNGVKEPGVVYRCPILDTCKLITLDSKGAKVLEVVNRKPKYYVDEKSGAWIGGAMDLDEETGRFAVCGHRWGYVKKEDQFSYMLGICYWSDVHQSISSSSGVNKLIPLLDPANYFHAYKNNPYYLLNYGVGQAGISVHFPKSKEKPEILIGAPGVSNWKGSSVIYKSENNWSSNFNFSNIMDPRSVAVEQYTLFGYQVTSGKFDKSGRIFYVVGNPKGSNKGKVLVYTYTERYNVNVVKWLDGYQTGEYFGSSLAVADIDCDGIDDLIVGAPQYTVNHDEGRIYIFISNLQNTLFQSPTFITGKIAGGRFGSAITGVGDLDKDSCDDIAVGAPYANNNTGVVYLYNGDNRGLFVPQEISASSIDPQLRGFGISISRGTDIDNNGYPDVAVGAYLSEKAVLFRAQPVVYLDTRITTNTHELKRDTKSFVIRVCLSYTGTSKHIPDTLHVSRNIIADEKLSRAHFMDKRNTMSSAIIIKNKETCNDIEVFLLKTALEENSSDPVTVKVTQQMINSGGDKTTVMIGTDSSSKSKDGFKKDNPVVNEQRSKRSAVLTVPFATECGNHSECEAELQLNCSFSGIKNGVYIIGSQSKLKLEVNLTNNNEPAYRTIVNISIPYPIHLSSGDKKCRESTSNFGSLLLCSFGNPLRNGTLKNLTLNLDTSGVKPSSKNLTFLITVSTSSKDKNEVQNQQQLELNFIVDANMNITGRADEVVYNYDKTNKTIFKHRFEVQKQGLSPIEEVEIELNIPISLTGPIGKTFLDLFRPLAYFNAEQELACKIEGHYEYHREESMEKGESLDIGIRSKREAVQNDVDLQPNQTLYLNCSSPNVQCIKIKCYAGPFYSDLQDSASIELKMIMNTSILAQELGERITIFLSTQGSVSIKEPKISERIHNVIINTTFVNGTYVAVAAAQTVETWIIALSIIAGIFILMLIVVGFIKAGFFERKKKEELKSLMAVYATNVFTTGMTNKSQDKDDDDGDDEDDSACDSRDELRQGDSEEL